MWCFIGDMAALFTGRSVLNDFRGWKVLASKSLDVVSFEAVISIVLSLESCKSLMRLSWEWSTFNRSPVNTYNMRK